jgi:hypothetical protein
MITVRALDHHVTVFVNETKAVVGTANIKNMRKIQE